MGKKLLKYLKNLIIIGLSLYLSICLLLYFFQDKLLFHPKPKSLTEVAAILKHYPDFDTSCYVMQDGIRIETYLSKDTSATRKPLILYFGGNTEEVSHLMEWSRYFDHCIVSLNNYRGFGRSTGNASEKTMFHDALEIYDHLKSLSGVDTSHIIVIGRSIGTGVATYLSSQRKVSGTILITPYESMIAVAQEKYSFVPIGLLIKHPFESNKYAVKISSPVLALIAAHDAVIPKQHAYNLLKSWKGKTEFLEVDADHNTIMDNEDAWKSIKAFIKEDTATIH